MYKYKRMEEWNKSSILKIYELWSKHTALLSTIL